MSGEFSRVRRFAVSLIALACAAVLFRSEVAQALVIRGDDYLYRGDRTQALERYRRALAIAPLFSVAVDRYVFVSMQRQSQRSLQAALVVASRYLRVHRDDPVILTDRALCYLHMHRYAAAQDDFQRAAHSSHAVSDYVFAGWAARDAGRKRQALRLWHKALHVQPGYAPARIALREDY